jgi:NAD-dependent SIR2 family protein deacetylase
MVICLIICLIAPAFGAGISTEADVELSNESGISYEQQTSLSVSIESPEDGFSVAYFPHHIKTYHPYSINIPNPTTKTYPSPSQSHPIYQFLSQTTSFSLFLYICLLPYL